MSASPSSTPRVLMASVFIVAVVLQSAVWLALHGPWAAIAGLFLGICAVCTTLAWKLPRGRFEAPVESALAFWAAVTGSIGLIGTLNLSGFDPGLKGSLLAIALCLAVYRRQFAARLCPFSDVSMIALAILAGVLGYLELLGGSLPIAGFLIAAFVWRAMPRLGGALLLLLAFPASALLPSLPAGASLLGQLPALAALWVVSLAWILLPSLGPMARLAALDLFVGALLAATLSRRGEFTGWGISELGAAPPVLALGVALAGARGLWLRGEPGPRANASSSIIAQCLAPAILLALTEALGGVPASSGPFLSLLRVDGPLLLLGIWGLARSLRTAGLGDQAVLILFSALTGFIHPALALPIWLLQGARLMLPALKAAPIREGA